jgi:hypothetical protein
VLGYTENQSQAKQYRARKCRLASGGGFSGKWPAMSSCVEKGLMQIEKAAFHVNNGETIVLL